MEVREARLTDAGKMSQISMASFMAAVAPSLSQQGIESFQQIASEQGFYQRMQQDNLMWVAVHQDEVVGVIELKQGQHIATLFIDPNMQKQGIGRALINKAVTNARKELITVKASLISVLAYKRYGFELSGDIAEAGGLVYQPMQLKC